MKNANFVGFHSIILVGGGGIHVLWTLSSIHLNLFCYLPFICLQLMNCTEDQCYELHEDSPLATFEILLDIVLGKSRLTEADLMQLLEMLGTVTECKRVQPLDYVGLYTSSERWIIHKNKNIFQIISPTFIHFVTYCMYVVFSWYTCFLNQYRRLPHYSGKFVESVVKHP